MPVYCTRLTSIITKWIKEDLGTGVPKCESASRLDLV